MDAVLTGKIINKKRKELGMTQVQLAEKLNVSNRAVSKWENGDGYPDITILPLLAQTLQITVDELLGVEAKAKQIESLPVDTADTKQLKRIKAKFMIEQIIAFCLSVVADVICSITEYKLINIRPFYVFIEIYLLVLSLILFVVSVIVFFTGFVSYKAECDAVSSKTVLSVYAFCVVAFVMPFVAIFRMLYWILGIYAIIFSVLVFLALVAATYFVIKKIKGERQTEKENCIE